MFNFGRENTGIIAKWWRNVDKEILFLFTSLFLLGLFFSFSSTSSIVAEKMHKETYFFFIKHFIFVLISLFLVISISIQDKNKIIKFLPALFAITILFLFLVVLTIVFLSFVIDKFILIYDYAITSLLINPSISDRE